MKKVLLNSLRRNVNAASEQSATLKSFTADDVFCFLKNIQELQDYEINMRNVRDGSVDYQIGNSVYNVKDITKVVYI